MEMHGLLDLAKQVATSVLEFPKTVAGRQVGSTSVASTDYSRTDRSITPDTPSFPDSVGRSCPVDLGGFSVRQSRAANHLRYICSRPTIFGRVLRAGEKDLAE